MRNAAAPHAEDRGLHVPVQGSGRRFAETVQEDAQGLLALARSNPGTEQVGVLGGEKAAGVLVDILETLGETYIAFSVVRMDSIRPLIILRAFFQERRLR